MYIAYLFIYLFTGQVADTPTVAEKTSFCHLTLTVHDLEHPVLRLVPLG